MSNRISACIVILSIVLSSCNSGETSNIANSADTTDSASKPQQRKMQDEQSPASQIGKGGSEMNDYSSFPIDSIKINFRTKDGELVGYRKGDTLVVEGDILMKLPPKATRGVATTIGLWPRRQSDNSIAIRYSIDPEYPYPSMVKAAVGEWTQKTGVRFIEARSGSIQGDFIDFVPSNATQSYIGHTGGRQTIELADWARVGNIMHEIGHALGLYHEQSRFDRDRFVSILCPNNINYARAFLEDPYARDIGDYNFYSIMHYPLVQGCLELKPGVRENYHLPSTIPGQRDTLTKGDIKTVKKIYLLNQVF